MEVGVDDGSWCDRGKAGEFSPVDGSMCQSPCMSASSTPSGLAISSPPPMYATTPLPGGWCCGEGGARARAGKEEGTKLEDTGNMGCVNGEVRGALEGEQ